MANHKKAGNKAKSKGQKPASPSPSTEAPITPAAVRPKMAAPQAMPKQPQVGKPVRAPKVDVTEDADAPMKRQQLIAKVVERSGVQKKHAKPVIEAMLAVLGDTLAEGRDLNLQPLGKLTQKRKKETGKARVIVASIRQKTGAGDGATAGAPGHKDPGDIWDKEAVADVAE
ncbi:HU family DNA-binding protein [Roseovarius dicentrarchi]|uniref:HU family DNA-binding protein n=1 Tax=Roseovarius dicentrarchi TaxID=2250573 RepID=UPI001EF107D9|nr:HU family DNA-binding protein [Roseovarius dicentrarchi]